MADRKKAAESRMAPGSVEGYFARLDPEKRAALLGFRRTLKALLPKAEECIRYGIPAFRHPDGVVVYYAAMKAHLSFFPTSYPIEACAEDLEGYATSRGTIRFPIGKPLPKPLVKKLVGVRLAQMAQMAEKAAVKTGVKGAGKGSVKRAARPAARAAAPGAVREARPKPRLNAAWHRDHLMPRNAKPAERAAWHLAHAKACGCRPIPASVAAWLKGRKPAGD